MMNPRCAPWGNGRVPPPRKNSAPARSFPFTKTFTERCWGARHSRHQLFRIRQNGKPQPQGRPAGQPVFDPPLDHMAAAPVPTDWAPVGLLVRVSTSGCHGLLSVTPGTAPGCTGAAQFVVAGSGAEVAWP